MYLRRTGEVEAISFRLSDLRNNNTTGDQPVVFFCQCIRRLSSQTLLELRLYYAYWALIFSGLTPSFLINSATLAAGN